MTSATGDGSAGPPRAASRADADGDREQPTQLLSPDEDEPRPQRPELTDAVLVARAAAGDPRAFERLVRRHQQQMYHVALRITGNSDDAEDAAQNAFIAAWKRLPDFRGDAKFSTWLYRIVTNHALNQVRSRKRTDQHADIASLLEHDEPASTDPGPDAHAQGSALLRDLRTAIAALPPDLRTCWYAREIDGLSYQEVAVIAGVSFDVVRGRIYRARLRLADDLKAWR